MLHGREVWTRAARHACAVATSVALAAVVVAVAAMSGPVRPAAAADERPPRHPVLVWTYDEDVERPGLAEALRSLGATGLQCPSYRDPAPWKAAGLQWYEDHAAGKGTLGLRDEEWRPAREKVWDARFEAWPAESVRARPRCLRDPKQAAAMEAKLRGVLPRARDGASWIVLEDEPSIGARVNPLDWCLCDRCVAAFRTWARERYGDLAKLNAEWGTSYAAWDDVRPWTTTGIRDRELPKDPSKWNLAPWTATRAFQDASFAAAVRPLTDLARAEAPGVPVGLAGLQAPSAFGGYDYATLLPGQTFVEPYDIGLALPVCRDLAAPGTVIAQTVFPDDDLRVARWRLWRGVARGADATIVWSSRDALRFDAAAKTWSQTPYGAALAADFRRLAAPGGIGGKLAAASPVDEGIVVVLSQPSIRVRWMLDSAPDGPAWLNRTGSYEAAVSGAVRSRRAAWDALAGRQKRFVDASAFETEGGPPLPAKAVVVLPDLVAASDAVAACLDRLAKRGVVVVADAEPRTFDETGRARKPGIPGVVVDPGFARLAERVEKAVGPPALRVTAVRADGGKAPAIEVALRRDAEFVHAVCVPVWEAAPSDDGSAAVAIPATKLTLTFAFGDGRARAVRDAWDGRELGTVATWTATVDAASPTLWCWGVR